MEQTPVDNAAVSAVSPREQRRRHNQMLLKVVLFAMVWCAITASWPSRERRGPEEIYEGNFDTAIKFQIAAWSLVGVASVVLLGGRLGAAVQTIMRSSLRWYALFVAVALCSTVWSVSPRLTAFRALQLCSTLLLVVLVLWTTGSNPVYTLYFCYACTALMALAAAACWVLLPGETESALGPPVFRGTLSIVAAISAVATIPRAMSSTRRNAGRWMIAVGLLAVIVFAGRSRGVIVAFSLVALLAMLLSPKGRLAALFLATTMICAAFAYGDQLWDYLNRADVGTGGDIWTLNGRLPIWIEILSMRHELPWLGRGFVAGSRDWFVQEFIARGGGFAAQHAHNAWLSALIETGLPGLFCMATIAVVFIRWSGRIMLRAVADEPRSYASILRVGFALAAVFAVVISIPWNGLAARACPTLLPMLLCCYWIRPATAHTTPHPVMRRRGTPRPTTGPNGEVLR